MEVVIFTALAEEVAVEPPECGGVTRWLTGEKGWPGPKWGEPKGGEVGAFPFPVVCPFDCCCCC